MNQALYLVNYTVRSTDPKSKLLNNWYDTKGQVLVWVPDQFDAATTIHAKLNAKYAGTNEYGTVKTVHGVTFKEAL